MKNRIERVNGLIKRELGSILLREIEMPEAALVTITRVVASGNLQEAKVYISIVPDEKGKEVLGVLRSHIAEIQEHLNERLNMRPVPKIIWAIETAGARARRIEDLFDQIKQEGA